VKASPGLRDQARLSKVADSRLFPGVTDAVLRPVRHSEGAAQPLPIFLEFPSDWMEDDWSHWTEHWMTPDEHYLEAEKLLAQAAGGGSGGDQDRLIARAHVHALLATRAAAPTPKRTDTSWMDVKLPGHRPPRDSPAQESPSAWKPPSPWQTDHVPTKEVVDYPGDDPL
jgi:hypothetical protein